jgi:hypothetical protein
MIKRNMKIGRPKNPPGFSEILKEIMPLEDIFEEKELILYNSLIEVYLKDFDEEDLTSGDMDDIMSMAMNRVLEMRLLTSSKGNVDKQLDVSQSIERLRKQTEKIKENLSARRKDRINPNEFKGFSIVDLAVAFDEEKRKKLARKINKLNKEEIVVKESRKDYSGNRYDIDSEKIEGEKEEV